MAIEVERDTIFALSSGRPPAAIAVVRISGPRAGAALKALSGKIPEPRKAAFVRVRDPQTNEPIDEALALWFPAPASETGEDVAELQFHGGRAVIAATLAALGKVEGLRPAEAGEFTRRAFENGKLDLTAVEGLADLVMAETEGQRRQALRQMQGSLGKRAESWREKLTRALALIEARIDFSDEADVPEDLVAPALALARELETEIAAALADDRRGERLREGLVVAIAGPPNAGKSTLLNRIARREAAIVSPYAGTTRDVIEVHLDLHGLPVTLLDTAGIRDTGDPVEMEGVRRARERAAAADLLLWVVDAGESAGEAPPAPPAGPLAESKAPVAGGGVSTGGSMVSPSADEVPFAAGRDESPQSADEAPSAADRGSSPQSPPVWLVRNKIDLFSGREQRNELVFSSEASNERHLKPTKVLKNIVNDELTPAKRSNEQEFITNENVFNISAATGEGLDVLLARLAAFAEAFLAGAEPALVTRERHRRALEDALAALRRALKPELAGREDLLAEELRLAARALGRLTGRVDVEDILDVIFGDFCIGK
jgi:tRNA modification GTPase